MHNAQEIQKNPRRFRIIAETIKQQWLQVNGKKTDDDSRLKTITAVVQAWLNDNDEKTTWKLSHSVKFLRIDKSQTSFLKKAQCSADSPGDFFICFIIQLLSTESSISSISPSLRTGWKTWVQLTTSYQINCLDGLSFNPMESQKNKFSEQLKVSIDKYVTKIKQSHDHCKFQCQLLMDHGTNKHIFSPTSIQLSAS